MINNPKMQNYLLCFRDRAVAYFFLISVSFNLYANTKRMNPNIMSIHPVKFKILKNKNIQTPIKINIAPIIAKRIGNLVTFISNSMPIISNGFFNKLHLTKILNSINIKIFRKLLKMDWDIGFFPSFLIINMQKEYLYGGNRQ